MKGEHVGTNLQQPSAAKQNFKDSGKQTKKPVEMRTSNDVHFLFGEVLSRAIGNVEAHGAAPDAPLGLPSQRPASASTRPISRSKSSNAQ
jgi:hypothetical protein